MTHPQPVVPGHLVTITARDHPWYGESGRLSSEVLGTGQLVVDLFVGARAGVYPHQITRSGT